MAHVNEVSHTTSSLTGEQGGFSCLLLQIMQRPVPKSRLSLTPVPRCCGGEEGRRGPSSPSAEDVSGVPARRLGRRFVQSWVSHLAPAPLVLGPPRAFLHFPRALQNRSRSVQSDAWRLFHASQAIC